jgi:hypothetical protein
VLLQKQQMHQLQSVTIKLLTILFNSSQWANYTCTTTVESGTTALLDSIPTAAVATAANVQTAAEPQQSSLAPLNSLRA